MANVSSVVAPFLASPVIWVALTGVFLGAALSRATTRTRNRRRPERARTVKWVLVCAWLSIAIVLGMLAIFVPGPERILNPRLAWVLGIATVVSFGAARFKRSLGIPVVVLLVAVVVIGGAFLQSIHAFTGETEIARVRVIDANPSEMRLEVVPRGTMPVLLTMKGTYFAPIVKVVIFDDLLVFLGAKTWYRFEGLTSFDQNLRQQNTDYRLPLPVGITETVWSFFERNETKVPGVKTAQIEMTLKRAQAFESFRIMVQNDGGVQIVPRAG
ncbi:MAG TPA: hypothetical protein VHE79_00175 [Spirochaetia bacterium]